MYDLDCGSHPHNRNLVMDRYKSAACSLLSASGRAAKMCVITPSDFTIIVRHTMPPLPSPRRPSVAPTPQPPPSPSLGAAAPGKKPPTPQNRAVAPEPANCVDVVYYLQYSRVFLLPGTRPRASIQAMAILRTICLSLVLSGVLWDVFGAYNSAEGIDDPMLGDHVAWLMRPTNWLSLLTIVYLATCIYASWVAPNYAISAFDPLPIPWLMYLVIWNLFNVLMPLSVSALVAHIAVLHTHDRAYVLAMASTFVTFVFVELYFGSHVPVVQLITTPSVCLLVFYGYTAWVATSLSEVMYTPLNWRDEPVDALICAARLLILAAFIGGICYCIISARGEYICITRPVTTATHLPLPRLGCCG